MIVKRDSTRLVPSASTALGRRQLPDQELATLIGYRLKLSTARAETFTAFDVTTALRRLNPSCEIDHERCKRLVHYAMGKYFVAGGNGTYDKRLTQKGLNQEPAWEYSPAPRLTNLVKLGLS